MMKRVFLSGAELKRSHGAVDFTCTGSMAVHAGLTETRTVVTVMARGPLQHYSTFAAQLQQLLKNKIVQFPFLDLLIP